MWLCCSPQQISLTFDKVKHSNVKKRLVQLVTGENPKLTNPIKNQNKNQEIWEHFLIINGNINHGKF